MRTEPNYSLYIYGSSSRGEQVEGSDIDILVVLTNTEGFNQDQIKLPSEVLETDSHIDISYYSLERLQQMYETGHLFAWHLFREAKHLGVGLDLLTKMGRPSEFMSFVNNVKPLIKLLKSSEEELSSSNVNVIYEAGLVYVCARNIAMPASYYSPLGLTFSTYSPFLLGYEDNPFPLTKRQYKKLRYARLAGTRGSKPIPVSGEVILQNISDVIDWAMIEYSRVTNERYYEEAIC